MAKKTCYERFVELVLANAQFLNSNELIERGHSQSEIQAFHNYAEFIKILLANYGGSLNDKKEFMRHYAKWCRFGFFHNWEAMKKWAAVIGYPEDKLSRDQFPLPMPMWHLTEEGIDLIKKAEQLGRGEHVVLEYEDQYEEKTACCYPYKRIPYRECGRKDIFVVFSGHQETGTKAVEAVYYYVHRYRQLPEGVIFLGLEDNQNLTEFNPKFEFRKSSEYRMYMRQAIALGLPKDWLRNFLMTPRDTDTSQNIQLLIETLNKYGQDNVNLIFISYPVYQMRVMSEFTFGLAQSKDAPNCYVRIADIAPKKEDGTMREQRFLSYDKPEFQLFDLSLANGVAHLFRERGKTRFALPDYDEYPEEFKPLAPLGLGYSYPNVVHELCGTDETVAAILKIMRTLMLDAHDEGISGQVQDAQQAVLTTQMEHLLWDKGFTDPVLMKKTRLMSEKQFLEVVG